MGKRQTGNKYEQIVCDYLIKKGMKIIDRNYTVKGGEIDIVAIDGEYICFIEVKFRTAGAIDAYSSVGISKQRRIIKSAERFIEKTGYNYQPRFDVVFVFSCDGELSFEYIKNAFDASVR